MIVILLGSNLGDRLKHLRRALHLIKTHPHIFVEQVSPVYVSDALLKENAKEAWNIPYLNAALRCISSLTPNELLHELKQIEVTLGRKLDAPRWSPRVIDIDILTIDDMQLHTEALTLPHPRLEERPFALWPLTDVAPLWQLERIHSIIEKWGSKWSGEHAPLHTKQIMQRIDTPQLVGILNVTSNSFSDGGKFIDREQAVTQAIHLINGGAEIVDVGAEATSPHASPLTADEEWQRLLPILVALRDAEKQQQFLLQPKISVDTYHPETAQKAIDFGVDWINDVTGLSNPKMREIIASVAKNDVDNVDCVMMHHVSIPASGKHIVARDQDPVKVIYEWGQRQLDVLETMGIKRERIIFDPGIGFGKVPEHSLTLIKHASRFAELGVRLLYGHSRKLYLALFTDKTFAERDLETAIISLYLAQQKDIDYLRVHNVELCSRAFKVNAALA